jgi:hypothetical protein
MRPPHKRVELAGLPSQRELVQRESKEGKLTKVLVRTRYPKIPKGAMKTPLKFLAPRAGLGHYGQNILFLPA